MRILKITPAHGSRKETWRLINVALNHQNKSVKSDSILSSTRNLDRDKWPVNNIVDTKDIEYLPQPTDNSSPPISQRDTLFFMLLTIAEDASNTIENLKDTSSWGCYNISLSCNTNCLHNIIPSITCHKYLISCRNILELTKSSEYYTHTKKRK